MMRFYYVLVAILVAAIIGYNYWNYTNNRIKGTSEDGMWEAVYKNQKQGGISFGWSASIEQTNEKEVTVKQLEFLEDGRVVVTRTEFEEMTDIDGAEYTLHPFSYPQLYLGDAPKENLSYEVRIVWEDDSGKEHTDRIKLE
ncbi:MAG: hypothetical protein ACI33P_01250 [Lysinibacillus sp.]